MPSPHRALADAFAMTADAAVDAAVDVAVAGPAWRRCERPEPPARRALRGLLPVALLMGLAACSSVRAPPTAPGTGQAPVPVPRSTPGGSPAPTPSANPPGASERDGPEPVVPPELLRVPDAEPRIEPARSGGPNKPYEVLGQAHVPVLGDPPLVERGLASWYGRKFHGRRTANGEVYDMYAMTAAHKTMPLPSYARVRNPANGREVVVRVNDRGPFHAGRVIDLSYTAALKLGLLGGVGPVELERITHEAIRTGSWRRVQGDPSLASLARPIDADIDPIAEIARRVAAEPEPAALSVAGSVAGPAGLVAPAGSAGSAALAKPAGAAPAEAPSLAAVTGGFWLQLAAFRDATAAEDWRRQLLQQADWLTPWLAVLADSAWHRVQAGPYANRSQAQSAADRLKNALRLAPMVVERR